MCRLYQNKSNLGWVSSCVIFKELGSLTIYYVFDIYNVSTSFTLLVHRRSMDFVTKLDSKNADSAVSVDGAVSNSV